jgi:predicted NAD/FAD-binding protein
MIADLFRFYREAPRLLNESGPGPSLGEFLEAGGYGALFRDDHIVPMASALWSSPSAQILAFPMKYLAQFMANHHMLQINARPEWRVVRGGSTRYVSALRRGWRVHERLDCPVQAVRRDADGVQIDSAAGRERFDHVVLACHSDQALQLLADASIREQDILGAMRYQANDTILHTDAGVLPQRRKAWAAWNAWIPRDADDACALSYCMNLLQGIESPDPLVVTLNRTDAIDPRKILRRMRYHHPIYTHASVAAQQRRAEIQGVQRTWFAGAYWGWGFHEDGMRSAVDVATALGIRWSGATQRDGSAQADADAPPAALQGAPA